MQCLSLSFRAGLSGLVFLVVDKMMLFLASKCPSCRVGTLLDVPLEGPNRRNNPVAAIER